MSLLAQALDQLHAETSLQFAYLHAHGRLGKIEPACRRREAPALGHCLESSQLIQVEAAHLKSRIIQMMITMNLHYSSA